MTPSHYQLYVIVRYYSITEIVICVSVGIKQAMVSCMWLGETDLQLLCIEECYKAYFPKVV